MRVLEALGSAFEQMGRDAQRSALEEERREQQLQQAEQQRAQEGRRHDQDEAALLQRARNSAELNPFGAGRSATTVAAKGDSAQTVPDMTAIVPARAGASAPLPACTNEAITPLMDAIAARTPKTEGICDSGRAGKKMFGDMLKLVEHCPSTGPWGQTKQWLREQLEAAEGMERDSCG